MWEKYYQNTSGRKVSELLLKTLKIMEFSPRLVYDLGCGAGNESKFLASKECLVNAYDNQIEASKYFENIPNLKFYHINLIELDFSSPDLIIAYLSLPFLDRETFFKVWNRILKDLKPGSYFSCSLLGNKDDWYTKKDSKKMTFTTKNEISEHSRKDDVEIKLLNDFLITRKAVNEQNEKEWHIIEVILRKKV